MLASKTSERNASAVRAFRSQCHLSSVRASLLRRGRTSAPGRRRRSQRPRRLSCAGCTCRTTRFNLSGQRASCAAASCGFPWSWLPAYRQVRKAAHPRLATPQRPIRSSGAHLPNSTRRFRSPAAESRSIECSSGAPAAPGRSDHHECIRSWTGCAIGLSSES